MPRPRLPLHKCERQDLNWHAMLSDVVATVRQSLGRGFGHYGLIATAILKEGYSHLKQAQRLSGGRP